MRVTLAGFGSEAGNEAFDSQTDSHASEIRPGSKFDTPIHKTVHGSPIAFATSLNLRRSTARMRSVAPSDSDLPPRIVML